MGKKNRNYRKYGKKHFFAEKSTHPEENNTIRLENRILQFLFSAQVPVSTGSIKAYLQEDGRKKKQLQQTLDRLITRNLIKQAGKNKYTLSSSAGIHQGRLVQHNKGFGFVEVTAKNGSSPFSRDPFISSSHMNGAVHGDTVLIRILRTRKDKRPEGAILQIIEKGSAFICGILKIKGSDFIVIPDDHKIPFTVRVDQPKDQLIPPGTMVKVELNRNGEHNRSLRGKIIAILGQPDQLDTQMNMVIEKFKLPCTFNEQTLQEADKFSNENEESPTREDLTQTAHITIDGETAKDFDDAIFIEQRSGGYRLYVSIADVSHFVLPGSAIDKEAYQRGTSVYFPGRVIPMLPEKLSNDLCSLVPGERRNTVTACLDFDNSGSCTAQRFFRSVIKSRQRFTYTIVQQIFNDDQEVVKQYQTFVPQLKLAQELAARLGAKRRSRGSIDFDLAEPLFTLNENEVVEGIQRAERNEAHKVIEEFMLAANEAAARFLEQGVDNPVFRIHEPPDDKKLENYLQFIKAIGINTAPFTNTPAWFAETAQKLQGTRFEYIASNLLVRSMNQAKYSVVNLGHFGLAAPAYTHFTSPIRRYPDLIVHRQLLSKIEKTALSPPAPSPADEAAAFLSKRERTAVEAERDMNDRLKVAYMKDKIGERFQAVISGVTESTLYVELQELCISGAVPIELMVDDYYYHDPKNLRIFGEITLNSYTLGDRVTVELIDVSLHRKQLTFTIIREAPAPPEDQ